MEYEADLSKLALTSCDFYISYKYHSALIANVLGIPGLAVCATSHAHYPNKMRYLAKTCDYLDHLVEDASFERDAAAIVAERIEQRGYPRRSRCAPRARRRVAGRNPGAILLKLVRGRASGPACEPASRGMPMLPARGGKRRWITQQLVHKLPVAGLEPGFVELPAFKGSSEVIRPALGEFQMMRRGDAVVVQRYVLNCWPNRSRRKVADLAGSARQNSSAHANSPQTSKTLLSDFTDDSARSTR